MVLLLTNSDVERSFNIELCLAALEQAYKDLSNRRAINRPRSHTFTPTAKGGTFHLFKTIEGGSPALGVFALRINSELWSIPAGVSARIKKIPSVADGRYTEFILLFSVETGELLAILPDGYIQKMRVALTHALAAKYMARSNASVLGLFGSGCRIGEFLTLRREDVTFDKYSCQILVNGKTGSRRVRVSPAASLAISEWPPSECSL